MSGSPKNCSERILQELIKHWSGYTIKGNKPNAKGAKIIRTLDHQVVQRFKKNDDAQMVMIEAITKNTGWLPEHSRLGLGLVIPTPDYFNMTEGQLRKSAHYFNIAQQIRDKRDSVDALMRDIAMDPFDRMWRKKINKILRVRRPKR
jgi:hypothetical protein